MKLIEVLLIEDDPVAVLLMQEALKRCAPNVHFTVAENGDVGLALLQQGILHPALIIVDWRIPPMGGEALLKEYEPKTAPVVVFSGLTNGGRKHAQEAGASAFYTKPTDPKAYLEVARHLIADWTPIDGPCA